MFQITADNRQQRTTQIKSARVGVFFKFWEVLRSGIVRYPATKAQGKLTFSGQPSNGQTFTVGTRVYTFQTVLTNADGNVAIGANLAASIVNAINAINLDGVPSSQYASATVLHPDVSALANPLNALEILFTANVGGTAGNSIALATNITGATVDAATLGNFRAGVAEADADGIIAPHRRGGFSELFVGTNNSGWVYWSETNLDNYRAGTKDVPDGDDNGNFLTATELMGAYPAPINSILAAGATRKLYAMNYVDRIYNKLRLVTLATLLKDFQSVPLVAPYTVSTSNVVFKKIVLDSTRFVLFYTQAAGTTGTYGVAGQMAADGSVTYGTPVILDTNSLNNENFGADLINTDKIAFTKNLTSNFFFTQIMTISTVTISLGTAVQTVGIVSNRKSLVAIGTDKYLTAHIATTTVVLTVHTVSGTVITVGSNTVIAGSGNPMLAPNGTDKAQLAYTLTATGFWQTMAVTVVSTTPVAGTPIVIAYDGTYNFYGTRLYQLATDKFLFFSSVGRIGTTLNAQTRMRMGLITVASTTVTMPDTQRMELRSSFWDTNCNDFVTVNAGTEFLWYRWENARLTVSRILLSGTTLNVQDTFFRGAGYHDQDSTFPYYRGELWQSAGVMVVVPLSLGYLFYFIMNDTGGTLGYFADKSSSFDIRLNDDLLGTYTKTYPATLQPFSIAKDINASTFALSVKSNDSQPRFVNIDHLIVEVD